MEKDIEDNYLANHPSDIVPLDYMLSSTPSQPQISFDKLNFGEVMQFADFGPKLALNQSKTTSFEEAGDEEEEEEARFSENNTSSVQFLVGVGKSEVMEMKSSRRKRPRSMKSTEEVESQRMTHIAVERNRRRQMNEHLRVLRSLMPGSYVHRGDQAFIIGGAIEFVRELEQLLQFLESQKKRRLLGGGEAPLAMNDAPPVVPIINQSFNPSGLREDMAENKSSIADIEVRLLGFDALIKILSRRRTGQLIKIIAALEELRFNILHTNITTIEQTVLYSFNVKITDETSCTAEDIANSVQQILNFIDASTLMI